MDTRISAGVSPDSFSPNEQVREGKAMNIPTRTLRIDSESRRDGKTYYYWTCEECSAHGPYRGDSHIDRVVTLANTHGIVCANAWSTEVVLSGVVTGTPHAYRAA